MRILKFLIGAVICTVAMMTLASADVLTTTTDNKFVKNEVKTIAVAMPANCSALNGTLKLTNCTAVLSETFATKSIDINVDKFVVFGMNADVMVGANLLIDVTVPNDSQAKVEIINITGATPDAQEIVVEDFEVVLYSFLDQNADGLLNGLDVAISIGKIYQGNMTVMDLQTIINAALAEM